MLKVAALFSLKRARQRRKSIFGDIRKRNDVHVARFFFFSAVFFRQCKERWQIRIGIANEKSQNQRTETETGNREKYFFFRGERERAELTLLSPASFRGRLAVFTQNPDSVGAWATVSTDLQRSLPLDSR